MPKKIYWIDDSTSNMLKVVFGLFPKLWEVSQSAGIATGIIILGDGYKASEEESGWLSEDEKLLGEKIDDFFLEICQDEDGINGGNETYKRKKQLINNVVKFPFCTNEKKELINRIMDFWKDEANLNDFDEEKAEQLTKELVDTIGILEDGDCIAIDLVLFNGDRERIKKKKYPMLSMSLCNYIVNKVNKPCFLYSSFYFDQEFINEWKERYKKLFNKECPRIFRRTEIANASDNIVEEIKQFISGEKVGEK